MYNIILSPLTRGPQEVVKMLYLVATQTRVLVVKKDEKEFLTPLCTASLCFSLQRENIIWKKIKSPLEGGL